MDGGDVVSVPWNCKPSPAENGYSLTLMSARITGFLFFIVLAVVFGLGAFLAINARDAPAPGLVLCFLALAVGLARFTPSSRNRRPKGMDAGAEVEEHQLKTLAEDQARRNRGEFDGRSDG